MLRPMCNGKPDCGDLMTIEDFVSCCRAGGFIDYDGYGEWATNEGVSNVEVRPSLVYARDDIIHAAKILGFTHVVWYNR